MSKLPLCDICREPFEKKYTSLQKVCSQKCAIEHAKRKSYLDSIEGKKPRRAETLQQQLRLTQQVFNLWVRKVKEKDATSCISCDRQRGEFVEQAGHFLTIAAYSAIRFEPDNCFLQCEQCNKYKSGNRIVYEKVLIEKIGQERVDWLIAQRHTFHWDISELKKKRSFLQKEIRKVASS